MLRVLKKLFSDRTPETALSHTTPWELLVAVILSAQCTDKRVNEVTSTLFKKYPTLGAYVNASVKEFEKDIHSTGFFRMKTKHILAAAQKIQDDFNGKVPDTMEALLTLPGVARKTANVVLSNAFGINEGIAVDTHVRRFAIRFNLSDSTNPTIIERDLMKQISKKDWAMFSYYLILYGREICPARKHDCKDHPLTRVYPEAATRWPTARQ
jgi:endonuclease-3